MASSSTPPYESTIPSAWNLNEIYAKASNWSLQGDAQLLELMQSISKNIEARCTTTKAKINQMQLDLDTTSIRLENTTNKMLSLKNLQFMEARVHNEVEVATNTASTAVVAAVDGNQNELTTLQAIRLAVGNGLNMMGECYEKITLDLADDEDSDDEAIAVQKSIVYRSKNPHEDRPLPHLIGSKAWNEKWHIGLHDSDDEISPDDDAGNEDDCSPSSDVDSVCMSISATSIAPTISDSDYSVQASRSSQPIQPENFVSNSPLSVANDIPPPELRVTQSPAAHRQKVTNLFDESDSEPEEQRSVPPRVKVLPTPNDSSIFRPQKASNSVTVAANLFDDEPPEIDFPVKNERKPVNLFVDTDDEEEYVFQPKKLEPSTAPIAAPRISQNKPVNIFNDAAEIDEDDLFRSQIIAPAKKSNISNLFDDTPPEDLFDVLIQKQPKVVAAKSVLTKGLFDDFEDEFDDTVPNSTLQSATPVRVTTKMAPTNSIFDDFDDENDDFEKLIAQTNKSSASLMAKTIVAHVSKPEVSTLSTTSIFDDDGNENNTFMQSTTASMERKSSAPIQNECVATQPIGKQDDNIEDSLRTNSSAAPTVIAASITQKDFLENLFDDQIPDDDYDDLFSKPKLTSKRSSTDLFKDNTIFPEDAHIRREHLLSLPEATDVLTKGTITKSDSNAPIAINENEVSEKSDNSITKNHEKQQHESDGIENILDVPTQPKILETSKSESVSSVSSTIVSAPNRSNVFSFLDDDPQTVEDDIFYKSSAKMATVPKCPSEPQTLSAKSSKTTLADDAHTAPLSSTLFKETPTDNHQKFNSNVSRKSFNEPPSDDDEVDKNGNAAKSKPNRSTSFGLFDDLPPDDDFLSVSESLNQIKAKLSNGIFDDIPSDDDRMSSETISSIKSLKTTGNAALFDDLPPDDDIFGADASVAVADKPGHNNSTTNVYYDDFAETITSAYESKSGVHDVFSEEPPIDDEPSLAPETDQLDRAVTFKDNLSKFSQPSESWKKIESQPNATMLPKPKKLNENININVAALLPGARLPSFKAIPIDSVRVESTNAAEIIVPIASNPLKIESIEDDSCGRLVGLTRGRSKIQVQRKPSTRKARVNEFRKSMIAQELDDDNGQMDTKPLSNVDIVATSMPRHTSIADMFKNASPDDCLVPAVAQPQTPPMIDEEPQKDISKPNNGDWLFCAPKSIISIPPPRIESIDGKEDCFTEKRTNVLLFDDESEEDDWLAKSVSSTARAADVKVEIAAQRAETASMPTAKKAQKQSSFFSDDDDDDLFASLAKPAAKQTTTKASSVQVPQILSTSSGGGGGDGAIGTTKAKPKQAVRPAAHSIFSDDDDDDDDLFSGGGGKKSLVTVERSKPEKPLATTKTAALPAKGGLFGDFDDDDDDIFSSSMSKAALQKTSVHVLPVTKEAVKKPLVSEFTGDPLSDLLK